MVAAVAPAVPGLAGIAGELILIAAWLVLIGLSIAWYYSVGWALRHIADAFQSVAIPLKFTTLHPLRWVGDLIRAFDQSISYVLAAGADKCEWAILALWHGLTAMFEATLEMISRSAEETATTVAHVATVTVPRAISRATSPITHRLTTLQARVAHLAVAIPWLVNHRVNWLHRWALHELDVLRRGIDRTTTRLGHRISTEVGRVTSRVKSAEQRITTHGLRIGRLEKALAAGAFAAAVAASLGRLGLGWTRCNRVGKAGRAVCGMDADLLDELLEATVLLTGTFGLVQFAREVQGITDEASAAVRWLVQAD